jgi:ClpP class serine protease
VERALDPLSFLWIALLLLSFQPGLQRQVALHQRRRALARLAAERSCTVITLIHRQETLAFLGVPISRHIDIDDSEDVLRAVRSTPATTPIEIVLHTPGGLVLAASQIASALAAHQAPVTAVVPHYAMSGGTLVALACDEIVMDAHAALGPVDPQIGPYAAADIVAVLAEPGDHDDATLLMGEVSRKALAQVKDLVEGLLEVRMDPARAREVARVLTQGSWTHDHPLGPETLKRMGIPVRVGVGQSERDLLELYPQPRGRVSQVEYVSQPVRPPARGAAGRERRL